MATADFVRDNREEIDEYIRRKVPNAKINDSERMMWVQNDEYLYNKARAYRKVRSVS